MSLLNAVGITGFLGRNSGIGSWFRTNYGGDSTNGAFHAPSPVFSR